MEIMAPNSKTGGIAPANNMPGTSPSGTSQKKAGTAPADPAAAPGRKNAAEGKPAPPHPPIVRQDEEKASILVPALIVPATRAQKNNHAAPQPESPGSPGRRSKNAKGALASPPHKDRSGTAPAIKDGTPPSSPASGASRAPLTPLLRPASPASPSPPFTLASAIASPASPEAGALRDYLQSASVDRLSNAIFRDQHGFGTSFPQEWIRTVKHSMSRVTSNMVKAIEPIVAGQDLNKLVPPIGEQENFNWKPLERIFSAACKALIAPGSSTSPLPFPTMILLAEMVDELRQAPGYQQLDNGQRNKAVEDAVFSVAIFYGLIGSLEERLKNTAYPRLANLLGIYLKACFGVASTSRGEIAGAIVKCARREQLAQCAAFRAELLREVRRIAELRRVRFDDWYTDPPHEDNLEKNIDIYFKDTWLARADNYEEQIRKGRYLLAEPDGARHPCRSYQQLVSHVGQGSKGTLAETILHVAGERLNNFLCQSYLYSPCCRLFTDIAGRFVEPIPQLQSRFLIRQATSECITVEYRCTDADVRSVKLIGKNEEDEYDAAPALPASLEFAGVLHFFPNEEFEVGSVQIRGRNLHFFE